MGAWDKAVSQALTTPPYFLAFIFTIIAGYTSGKWDERCTMDFIDILLIIDRFFDRAYHMIGINVVGMVGFLLLMFIAEEQVGVRYFAACLSTIAVVRYDEMEAYDHTLMTQFCCC